MIKDEFQEKKKFKFYHVILLTMLFTTLVLFTVDKKNQERAKVKFQKEQFQKFDKIIARRSLSYQEDTDKVCKRGTKTLQNYYQTGDQSEIKVDKIKFDDSNQPEYITKIMDVITSKSDDYMSLATSYVPHALGPLVFLVVGILSIFGWIVCCFCCCCNCCCCCCCKKAGCKIPCFIICIAFNAVAIITCIIGLGKSNALFAGLANTECSILQFTNVIDVGEKKETLPRWAGFNGLKILISEIKAEVNKIGDTAISNLKSKNDPIQDLKDLVVSNVLSETYQNLPYASTPDYYIDYIYNYGPGSSGQVNVRRDLSQVFIDDFFKVEYTEVTKAADDYLGPSINTLENQFKGNDLTKTLDEAEQNLESLKGTIYEIKDAVSGVIIDYSGIVDDYGKLGFKVVFSVITIIDAAITAFMLLLCFCGGKSCQKCCCCRCFLKFFIHLLWNLLALFMIFSFIFGSLFTLIGTLGKDLFSVASILLGEKNLSNPNADLIGDSGKYLNPCIHGDGSLVNVLNLNTNTASSITTLKTTQTLVTNAFSMINKAGTCIQTYKSLIAGRDTSPNCKMIKPDAVPVPDVQACSSSETTLAIQMSTVNTHLDSLFADGSHYKNLINQYNVALTAFNDTISQLTNVLDKYSGTGNDAYAFLDCKFIGTNIKLVLKFLSEALGNDFYNIGIALILASCSIMLVIISTILEIVIINIAIDKNKEQTDIIPEIGGEK